MSEKWGSYSDLELDIAFDSSLDAFRLKALVSENEVGRAKNIVSYEDLDQKIRQDFCKRLEPIVEKHKDGINKDTENHIKNKFKNIDSVRFYAVSNSIELDYGDIAIEHYADGNEATETILSEVQAYDLRNESDSFKAFMADLEKLLNEYGFVVEDYSIERRFMSRERYD